VAICGVRVIFRHERPNTSKKRDFTVLLCVKSLEKNQLHNFVHFSQLFFQTNQVHPRVKCKNASQWRKTQMQRNNRFKKAVALKMWTVGILFL